MTDPADALVLFGATGDLARKKLFPALYHMEAHGELTIPVVGVAASLWGDAELRAYAESSIRAVVPVQGVEIDESTLDSLLGRISMVAGDYREASTFEALRESLSTAQRPTFYLAIPVSLFDEVIDGLVSVSLHHDARVVVEKPFGSDLASARELNASLARAFPESAIFRIDHYLGKSSVENLLLFRFANALFLDVWDRNHVEKVEITLAESFDVQGRGWFYDETGTLRDVVQNHALQILALLAMDPPSRADVESIRDEKAKVLRDLRPLRAADLARGQYIGYLDEEGVAEGSDTETFVLARCFVDSWRWQGVPFIIRAGKMLAETRTEAVVTFKAPPRALFGSGLERSKRPAPNQLRFDFRPGGGIHLELQTKAPGDQLVTMPTHLAIQPDPDQLPVREREAYELLLQDAVEGDQSRFARIDAVEASWKVVDAVLTHHLPAEPYQPGSWGPARAARLLTDEWS